MITINIKDAKTNLDTKILADDKVLGYIRSITLDLNGSYAEVVISDLNEKSEETARILVKHGFIVNRINPMEEYEKSLGNNST